GKSGKAFTFIVGKEIFGLKRIEKTYGLKVFRQNIPTLDELDETRLNAYSIKIKKIINENSHSKYAGLVEKLMGYDFSALDIAAALLKISMDNENTGFDNNQNFSGVSSFTEKKFVRNRSGNNRNNYRDKRNNSFKGQNMKNKNFKKK
ncbi:MAG TPA: ATP-dependent helicase, partial [bacterium]|nr:ATP-dependent helicase [bacterium]